MKATLSLTEVVLVVVLGGTFSSAKTLNSLESNENSVFEERWSEDRVRRDLQSFGTHISAATSLSLAACSPVPCTSDLSLDLCNAFCQANETAFGAIITSLYTCYLDGICQRNFKIMTLTNVNVSLGVDGYDGQCTLYGSNVTMTMLVTAPTTTQLDFPSIAAYTIINYLLTYSIEGLSVRCQANVPCAPPTLISPNTTCDCPNSCPGGDQTANNNNGHPSNLNGNQNVNQSSTQNHDFSWARPLFVWLGIDTFTCDCNEEAPSVEKRQAVADSTDASFDSPLSVYLFAKFQPVYMYSPGKTPFTQVGGVVTSALASLGSQASDDTPSDYQNLALSSIMDLFANYNVYNSLVTNYFSILNGLVEDFRTNKCPSTCNS